MRFFCRLLACFIIMGLCVNCFGYENSEKQITINEDQITYITEKLMDCFATGTIPVYMGSQDIGDYFNEDGIIKLTDNFDIEQLNEDLYHSKMNAIKDNFDRCMNVISADDLLYEEVSKYL